MDPVNFTQYVPDLDMFSRLPANTDVHVAKDGHFIANGDVYSAIPGIQSIVNVYKGHTSAQTAYEIDIFAKSVISALKGVFDHASASGDPSVKFKAFSNLTSAHAAIQNAIKGCGEHGGMQGLLKTYPEGPIHDSLEASINLMKTSACDFARLSRDLGWNQAGDMVADGLPFCPEAFFDDHDWAQAMHTGTQLREESIGLTKYYGNYSGALANTQLWVSTGQWNWWDKIDTFGNGTSLFLGALPMARGAAGYEWRNDLQEIINAGVGAVLSVVEVFENKASGYVGAAITPTQWQKAGINQLQLPTPDFETIPLDVVQRGVEFIHWNIKNGKSVYVHCKAGRGRSALIEMCYLIKYHGHTAKSAFQLIRSQRPQAGFKETDPKMATLLEFERLNLAK